jgi:hypothetical protein
MLRQEALLPWFFSVFESDVLPPGEGFRERTRLVAFSIILFILQRFVDPYETEKFESID